MKIPPRLRAFAVDARNMIARVGDQANTLDVSIGPFRAVLYNPTSAPIAAPPLAPAVSSPHTCSAPSRCLVCRATGKP